MLWGPVVGPKRQYLLAGEYMNNLYFPQSIYELFYLDSVAKCLTDHNLIL